MLRRTAQALIFGAVALALLVVPGCQLLPKEEEVDRPVLLPPPEERRQLAEVTRGYISQEMTKLARAEAVNEQELFFKQGGRVKSILVKYGDWVKQGDVIAQLDAGDLEYQLQNAQLSYEAAQISLDKYRMEAQFGGNISSADMRLKEIDYEKAKLAYEKAKQQYENATLRSPIEGKITALGVKIGDTVKEGDTIGKVSDTRSVRLVAEVSATDLNTLQEGLKLRLEYTRGNWIPGHVVHVPSKNDKLPSGAADLRVIVEADDPSKTFTFGSLYSVVITTKESDNALKVAKAGVREYFGRVYVRVAQGDGTIEKDVKVGIQTTDECEILEGLKEGDMVIISK